MTSCWRPRRRGRFRTPARSSARCAECSPIPARRRWLGTSPASGCGCATSRGRSRPSHLSHFGRESAAARLSARDGAFLPTASPAGGGAARPRVCRLTARRLPTGSFEDPGRCPGPAGTGCPGGLVAATFRRVRAGRPATAGGSCCGSWRQHTTDDPLLPPQEAWRTSVPVGRASMGAVERPRGRPAGAALSSPLRSSSPRRPGQCRRDGDEEQHRANPVCASCHRMMDPLGLALENSTPWGAGGGTCRAGRRSTPPERCRTGPIDGPAGMRDLLVRKPSSSPPW